METSWLRNALITAIAPLAWATTYVVTKEWLPPGRPLFSAAIRALPIGLVMLAFRPRLPRGAWWWRAFGLGALNIGAFFTLLFIGAYRLPGGLASTLQATGPIVMIVLAWVLAGERPRRAAILGSLLGMAGVAMMVLRAGLALDPLGIAASLSSVLVAGLGFIWIKQSHPDVDMMTLTAWQLIAGGLILAPLAWLVEGPPPPLDGPAMASYVWLGVVGTGLAYVVWFRGARTLPAASVATIGLLNPAVATLLGVVISGEHFGGWQLLGMCLVFSGVLLGQPAIVSAVTSRR